MKRFEFRLQRLLELRKQRERLAEFRQQQARAELAAAEQAVQEIEAQLALLANRLASGPSTEELSWVDRCQQGVQLGQQLETARQQANIAAQRYQEAAAQRTQISQQVEALLQLRRGQWHIHRQNALREHQHQMDEVGLRRWLQARTAGSASDLPSADGALSDVT